MLKEVLLIHIMLDVSVKLGVEFKLTRCSSI